MVALVQLCTDEGVRPAHVLSQARELCLDAATPAWALPGPLTSQVYVPLDGWLVC